MEAIRIIEQEHRSLAAVLHGLLYLVRQIRFANATPDFGLFEAMLDYIEIFSERFHHPKEDAYLFDRLGVRNPAAAALIERLQREHQSAAAKLVALRQALVRYREGGSSAFSVFAVQVAQFAAFHWDHMRVEEDDLLPLAKVHLTAADWATVDAAFLGHTDPLFGAERTEAYQQLFDRIVNLAPSPIGRAR